MNKIRIGLYRALVNTHPGIACRYHRFHDGAQGGRKLLSWAYLLWLNFAYYCLFCHFLGERPDAAIYEEKTPPHRVSESALAAKDGIPPEALAAEAESYDVVSFDVFDTLIFRPFGDPTDLFHIVGERLGILDFRELRIRAEQAARAKSLAERGHTEVTLAEIWEELETSIGPMAAGGMAYEAEVELGLCYANPYMLEVWKRLRRAGRRLIVVSDMYLPEAMIRSILEKNGFSCAEHVYVSCEYGENKAGGALYERVIRALGQTSSVFHIGDNPHSDGRMAQRAGWKTYLYPQCRREMRRYRPFDMSALVGSAYRGIVSNRIYCGVAVYSMLREYGYIYGGLFVTGYCAFIHSFCRRKGIDKLLFLARDGDTLKRAYDTLYPGEATAYLYWSRKASVKLLAAENRQDYFDRFLGQKTGHGYRLREILASMELEHLTGELQESFLDPEAPLTEGNVHALQAFLEGRWETVLSVYEEQRAAARRYMERHLSGCHHVAVVDIGWAGSGAMALAHLTERVWRLPCRVTGLLAGTNTIHNISPDAAEPMLQSGRLVSYLFSQSHNRDLLKKHNAGSGWNVFWELLLSSPTRPFDGFYAVNPQREADHTGTWCREEDVMLRFGRQDIDPGQASEIAKGILDFVREYQTIFSAYPYMLQISGRDACAPILAASGHNARYLKTVAKICSFVEDVV